MKTEIKKQLPDKASKPLQKEFFFYQGGRLVKKGYFTEQILDILDPSQGDTLRIASPSSREWRMFNGGKWEILPDLTFSL